MNESPPDAPPPESSGGDFERDVYIDKPGIVGARWWHRSLVAEATQIDRRKALTGILVGTGVLGAISLMGAAVVKLASGSRESVSLTSRKSLEMQRRYGWDFGARGRDLVFDGISERPFVRTDLEKLAGVLTPRLNAKFHVPTLVESLFSMPTTSLPDPPDGSPRSDSAPFRRLADVIVPVVTPGMERAYRAGEAFARHCARVEHVAALADLPGPEAVAFAAGACEVFEPVLLFDNWPHPNAVVPSHMALAALAYYQPRFATQMAERRYAEPLFLLDRLRMSPYSEEGDRFDNRYVARMPSLATLARDGVKTIFYVVGTDADLPEPDDLNATLSASASKEAGVTVRALALADFGNPSGATAEAFHYGGSADTDGSFWLNYPDSPGYTPRSFQRVASSSTKSYTFSGRSPAPSAGHIGTVPVAVTASGLIVAAALDRRGSMNRFSKGWGG